jgi:hypothetical protein
VPLTLFLLHSQGSDTPGLDTLASGLPDLDVVGLDLPAAPSATDVVTRIAAHSPGRWALAGLGATSAVATDVAQRTLRGETSLFGLVGVVPLESEEPADVEQSVRRWLHDSADRGPVVPDDFARVLASEHTSARTRGTLAARALGDDPAYAPRALSPEQLTTLRAVARRVVPQGGTERAEIDLAARVDAQLADGVGDGWRHDGQPVDVEAYRAALDDLAGFADLPLAEQEARLRDLGGDLWFEDCCTDLVRQWLAHPATMSRIGFDGVANGGDSRHQGFTLLTLGSRDDWEPAMPVQPVRPAAVTR